MKMKRFQLGNDQGQGWLRVEFDRCACVFFVVVIVFTDDVAVKTFAIAHNTQRLNEDINSYRNYLFIYLFSSHKFVFRIGADTFM